MKTTTLRLHAIRWKRKATRDDMARADLNRASRWEKGERFHFDWHFTADDWTKRRVWFVDRRSEKTA
jgi:hypothetical protein